MQVRKSFFAFASAHTSNTRFVHLFLITSLIVIGLTFPPGQTHAAENFIYNTIVSGLDTPTNFSFIDFNTVLVGEKSGRLVWVDISSGNKNTIYTIPNVNTYGDRGLVGMAIDPDFASNGNIYLSYTHENNPANVTGPKTARIVRVRYDFVKKSIDPGSYTILLGSIGGTPATPSCDDYSVGSDCIASNSSSHSAGGLRFGPDGKLYATIGDGAGFTAIDEYALNAQNLDYLTGKMLRLNTDGGAPSDNPFFEAGDPLSNRSKVFAYGFRNSFRFGFTPSGEVIAGEVGWFSHEEINLVQAGDNLGWPCFEGGMTQISYAPAFPAVCGAITNQKDPMYFYGHVGGAGNAVTGGMFGTNASYGAYQGRYFFGDYSEDFIATAQFSSGAISNVEKIITGAGGPVDIQVGLDGSIYYLAIYNGQLRKVINTSGSTEIINNAPQASYYVDYVLTDAPVTIVFHGEISSDLDGDTLSYDWDFGDGSTGSGATPSHTYTSNGTYIVSLTVTDPSGATGVYQSEVVIGDMPYNAAPVHVSTTYRPVPVYIGLNNTIETTFTNEFGGDDDYIIYWEVYDENNQRVYKYNQLIASTERGTITRNFSWTPPGLGNYRIEMAFFSNDWRKLYNWNSEVTSFTVVNRVGDETPIVIPFSLDYKTTAGNTQVSLGESGLYSVTAYNPGIAGTGIVYLEVRDQGNAIVFKEGKRTNFTANGSATTDFSWTPGRVGNYTTHLGLFTDNWAEQFGWWADTMAMTVRN